MNFYDRVNQGLVNFSHAYAAWLGKFYDNVTAILGYLPRKQYLPGQSNTALLTLVKSIETQIQERSMPLDGRITTQEFAENLAVFGSVLRGDYKEKPWYVPTITPDMIHSLIEPSEPLPTAMLLMIDDTGYECSEKEN